MGSKKAVIFDVDGTLLNTERVYMQAWREAGSILGYSIGRELLERTRGACLSESIRLFKETFGNDFPYDDARRIRVQKAESILKALSPEELRMPHAQQTLRELCKKGFKLAVASSTRYDLTEDHLKHAELFDLFEAVVGGDMVENGKPEPDIFLLAAKLLGVEPAEAVVVGDAPPDVFAATSAGMKVILIPDQTPANGQTSALSAKVMESLERLPEIIEHI